MGSVPQSKEWKASAQGPSRAKRWSGWFAGCMEPSDPDGAHAKSRPCHADDEKPVGQQAITTHDRYGRPIFAANQAAAAPSGDLGTDSDPALLSTANQRISCANHVVSVPTATLIASGGFGDANSTTAPLTALTLLHRTRLQSPTRSAMQCCGAAVGEPGHLEPDADTVAPTRTCIWRLDNDAEGSPQAPRPWHITTGKLTTEWMTHCAVVIEDGGDAQAADRKLAAYKVGKKTAVAKEDSPCADGELQCKIQECRRMKAAKAADQLCQTQQCAYCHKLFRANAASQRQQDREIRLFIDQSEKSRIPPVECPDCASFWSWADRTYILPGGIGTRSSSFQKNRHYDCFF